MKKTLKTNEKYYAKLPASSNKEDHCDLYFWFSHMARRGIPSDYGWTDDPKDVECSDKDTLMEFLTNTLASGIDCGDWSMEDVDAIEIHKVVETVVTETTDEVDPTVKVSKDTITEIGEYKYGWNDHEQLTTCPRCGEEGVPYGNCPHCGYDIH